MSDFLVLYAPQLEAATKSETWAEYVSKKTGLPVVVLPTGFELVRISDSPDDMILD